MTKKTPVRNLIHLLAVNIAVFLFIALTLEVGARLFFYVKYNETAWLKYAISYPASDYSHVGPNYYHDFGGYLAFWPKIHKSVAWAEGTDVHINKFGFRSMDFELAKPEKTYRIVTIGESSTFGFHVPDDKTWPFVLNKLFQSKTSPGGAGYTNTEVVNLGLPWYNTNNNLNLMQFVVSLKPDLVLFYGGANDIGDIAMRQLDQSLGATRLQKLLSGLEKYSFFIYKAKIFFQTRMQRQQTPEESLVAVREKLTKTLFSREQIDFAENSYSANLIFKNLDRFKSIAEANGAKFIIASQLRAPIGKDWLKLAKDSKIFNDDLRSLEKVIQTIGFDAYQAQLERDLNIKGHLNYAETQQLLHARYIASLSSYAKARGILLVDFVKYIEGNFSYLVTDLHLSEEGNARLAEAVFKSLSCDSQGNGQCPSAAK